MKRTKREENALVIINVIYGVLIVTIVYLLLSFIVPSIKEISLLKSSVFATYSDINRIEKEGLNHSEFKENINAILNKNKTNKEEDNLYLSEILKNIDEDFYNENIKNTKENDFNTFIDALSKKYTNNSNFDNKVEVISKILPVYSEDISDLGESALTDFKFINYIESIAETFNISFNNSIGISSLKLLDDYAIGAGDNNLDTNIFYIPLILSLNGTKSSILEFLYFVDNVGKIEIDDDLNIIVKNDLNKDFADFRNKVLKGQLKTQEYNIFNNQVFDIGSVEFDKYFDSSFELTDSKTSFISNIKATQGREIIKANVELRFYIKGIPMFKIENFIKEFIKDFQKTKAEVESYMSKVGQDSPKYQKLADINSVLKQIQLTVISGIQKKLSSKTDIDGAFKQVNTYKSILEDYKKDLEQFKK